MYAGTSQGQFTGTASPHVLHDRDSEGLHSETQPQLSMWVENTGAAPRKLSDTSEQHTAAVVSERTLTPMLPVFLGKNHP